MTATVRRELVLPLEPEQAWELVSDRRHLEEWLAPAVRIDLQPGGEAVFTWDDGEVRRGVVEEVDAPRRLAFRWGEAGGAVDAPAEPGESRVEVSVEAVPDGSRVVVVETGTRTVPGEAVTACLERELGWAILLRRLLAAGRVAAHAAA